MTHMKSLREALDKGLRQFETATRKLFDCSAPEIIDPAELHKDLKLIYTPPRPVCCCECRHRDKQEPRLCNHSLGIDVAINPWDSCEYGEREVEE